MDYNAMQARGVRWGEDHRASARQAVAELRARQIAPSCEELDPLRVYVRG